MHPRLLPYSPERDVYRLLGVPPSASSEEITAACRRLARTFHPDRNRSERATQEMQIVNAVRRVMTDPASRAAYDRARREFHAELLRGPVARSPEWQPSGRSAAGSLPPLPSTVAVASPLERYLRALLLGARAALVTLLPPRCRGCRTVIEREDAYCVACGTPLLGGG